MNATNLTSLLSIPIKVENFIPILSDKNAVYLYAYDHEIYNFQSIIESISSAIGFIALIMAFMGLSMPFGKLIILEALTVIQVSYFAIFQFEKIPPTFIGLKNLIYTNGYNP